MKYMYLYLMIILSVFIYNMPLMSQGPITPTDLLGRNEIVMIWHTGLEEWADQDVHVNHQIFKLKKDFEKEENKWNEFDKYPVTRSPFGSGGNRIMNGAAGDFNGDGLQEYALVNPVASDSFIIEIPFLDSLSHDTSAIQYFNGPSSTFNEPGLGNIYIEQAGFDDDNASELVIAYVMDSKINIDIYDVSTEFQINKKTTISDSEIAGYTNQEPLALKTGDLDNDGTDEIVLLFRSETTEKAFHLKVYNVNASFTIQPESMVLLEESAGENSDNTVPGITVADVNGDSISEIVCGFVKNDPERSFDTIFIVPVTISDDPATGEMNQLEKLEYEKDAITTYFYEGAPNYVHLESGDVSGDGKDEIFAGFGYVVMFENLDESVLKVEEKDVINWYASGWLKYFQVSNIDGAGAPELVTASIISIYNMRIYVHSFDEDNEETRSLNVETTNENPPYSFVMLTGDFDADRFRIGPGTKYEKTAIKQPMVILNAPPIHFDVFNDTIYDVNECYGDDGCNSFVQYTTTSSQEISVSATLKESYAVAGRVSGGGNFLGINVDAYVQSEYGTYFEQSKTKTEKITITEKVTASGDDWLYATVCDYEIWEYPVFNENGAIVDNIITLKPVVTDNRWFPSKQQSATGYVPKHEVGNILSYTPFPDLNNPDGEETLWGSYLGDNTYELDENSKYEKTIKFEEIFKTDQAVQRDVAIEVGGSVGGWGIQVDAAARYEGSSLSTHSLTVDKGLEIYIQQLGVDQEIGEVSYRVTPYIYWSANGALVVDYAVRPSMPDAGFTPTWWSSRYTIADPTFILPWKHDPEKGFTLEDEIKRQQTKSLTFSHEDPSAGDTITIRASIHNYSPYPTGTRIPISFYVGNPDNGGTIISDIHGESLFKTDDVIDYQNFQIVKIQWKVEDNLPSFPRIYAVIDPMDEIEEVHETNNVGWNVLGKTKDDSNPTTIDEVGGMFSEKRTYIYPNPTSGITNIGISLDSPSDIEIAFFNMNGQLIRSYTKPDVSVGNHTISFDLEWLQEGLYLCVVRTQNYTEPNKLFITK